jgi:hypothetical protein
MTRNTKHPRRMALPAAALAALLLAGCTSGHVGESWQCPLADTGTCDSVAAADPAVPDMDASRDTVLGEPLWRVRETGRGQAVEPSCDAACDGGFDPFAWLARLFGGEGGDGEKTAATGAAHSLRAEPLQAEPGFAALPGESATAPLPAEPESSKALAAGETSPDGHDDLRTDEVVARIWIAPFVDAGGVYREASYVRVVLEPAGWRLGR